MSPELILTALVGLGLFGFCFDQFLEYLNLKAQRRDIPHEIAAFYDREKYLKSLDYNQENTRFSFLTSTFGFVLSLAMLLGGFGWTDHFLRTYIQDSTTLTLAFFGLLALASDLITIPFQLYATFVIEEKYGFNKTTVKTFIFDKLKGYVLGALIGGVLLYALTFLILRIGPMFWLWFALIAAAFTLFINLFYTSLLLPLFNKLTPLQEGELKSAIEAYSKKVGFPLQNILVMDGSKRSSKANAFFSGFGKKKKIVLYDTLIANHTTDELVAVLAHEVGHYKKKHVIWSYVWSVLQITLTLYILSWMVFEENLSLALGGETWSIHLNLIAFAILVSPLSSLTGIFSSLYSRKNEFEADAFARQTFNGNALGNALKKLSVDTLSNLYPHPLYVFFHYSHPPLLARLKALETT